MLSRATRAGCRLRDQRGVGRPGGQISALDARHSPNDPPARRLEAVDEDPGGRHDESHPGGGSASSKSIHHRSSRSMYLLAHSGRMRGASPASATSAQIPLLRLELFPVDLPARVALAEDVERRTPAPSASSRSPTRPTSTPSGASLHPIPTAALGPRRSPSRPTSSARRARSRSLAVSSLSSPQGLTRRARRPIRPIRSAPSGRAPASPGRSSSTGRGTRGARPSLRAS